MKKLIIVIIFAFLFGGTLLAASGDGALVYPFSNSVATAQSENIVNPSLALSTPNPVRIVTPAENAHLPYLTSTFVCGSAPPESKLLINGIPVKIHSGGGFLAMVKLAPGQFNIKIECQFDGIKYQVNRTVFVAAPEQPALIKPLTIEYITLQQDQQLLPGDYVEVGCKGSPGCEAYFTVKGVKKKFPLVESTASPGIYQGIYQVGSKDRLKKSRIKVILSNQREKITKESEGTLSLFANDIPVMVETLLNNVVLRSGPALTASDRGGYQMFPPQGTILQINGVKGDEYRVRLTRNKTVWVSSNQVKQLPAGTPPAHVMVGAVSVWAEGLSSKIRIPLGRKIPFEIIPEIQGNYIDILFFGAYSNTDLITNPTAGIIDSVRWFQDDEQTYRLRVCTIPNSWWGYDARYEGNDFVVELRTPPPVKTGISPLAGLTIVIDPGHGGAESGAIGATGLVEKDVNLAQALNLKEKLLAKGVRVIMTRGEDEMVSLSDRPLMAWQNKADILISLHNNALPDGGNPLIKNGYGVYYFTPMSQALAKEIHRAYGAAFNQNGAFHLRDDGLYYDNLALTRAPQMPSVLVESAYMIVPEEEAYLKTDGFRTACSDAIINGLENYARTIRPKVSNLK